jgi:hypothetical protein
MNDDLDRIEEDLKKKDQPEKKVKVSGKSVFKLQEIIKKRADEEPEDQKNPEG